MQQTLSETQEVLNVTFTTDGRRPIQPRESVNQDCHYMSTDALVARSSGTTQCFMCSRIYFDQLLQKCPHCNSEAVQHYLIDDLNHFARDPLRNPYVAGTWIEEVATTADPRSAV